MPTNKGPSPMVLANEFYDQHFRGKGLAPRHASGLKKELFRAFKAGEAPMPAAKAFLKTKGIPAGFVAGVKTKAKTEFQLDQAEVAEYREVAADQKTAEKAAKKAMAWPLKERPEVFAEPSEVLDTKLLRETLKALEQASGVKLDAPANAKPEQLRRFIHEQIIAFVGPEDLSRFDQIDGGKAAVFAAIDNCVGICIDLRNAFCTICPDQTTCVQAYFTNLRSGFADIAEKYGLKLRSAEERVKAEAARQSARFAPEKVFVVFETESPFQPGTIEHAVCQQVFREGSAPLKTIRNTMEGLLGSVQTATFQTWIERFIELGVGCLAEELPEEAIASLSKTERRALGL